MSSPPPYSSSPPPTLPLPIQSPALPLNLQLTPIDLLISINQFIFSINSILSQVITAAISSGATSNNQLSAPVPNSNNHDQEKTTTPAPAHPAPNPTTRRFTIREITPILPETPPTSPHSSPSRSSRSSISDTESIFPLNKLNSNPPEIREQPTIQIGPPITPSLPTPALRPSSQKVDTPSSPNSNVENSKITLNPSFSIHIDPPEKSRPPRLPTDPTSALIRRYAPPVISLCVDCLIYPMHALVVRCKPFTGIQTNEKGGLCLPCLIRLLNYTPLTEDGREPLLDLLDLFARDLAPLQLGLSIEDFFKTAFGHLFHHPPSILTSHLSPPTPSPHLTLAHEYRSIFDTEFAESDRLQWLNTFFGWPSQHGFTRPDSKKKFQGKQIDPRLKS